MNPEQTHSPPPPNQSTGEAFDYLSEQGITGLAQMNQECEVELADPISNLKNMFAGFAEDLKTKNEDLLK